MDESQSKLTHELALKYTFETFDFKNKSPEDLLATYEDIYNKIAKVIENKNTELATKNMEMWSKLNY